MITFVYPHKKYKIVCASYEAFLELCAKYFPQTDPKYWSVQSVKK